MATLRNQNKDQEQDDGKYNKCFYLSVFLSIAITVWIFSILGVFQFRDFHVYISNNTVATSFGNNNTTFCFEDVRDCKVNSSFVHFLFRCARFASNLAIVITYMVMLAAEFSSIRANSGTYLSSNLFKAFFFCFNIIIKS